MTKPKLIFAPGAFDDFEGTQEELDKLVSEIHKKFEDGTLFADSESIDIQELDEVILERIESSNSEYPTKKTLH